MYGSAGIQTFTHQSHTSYACQGPYIATWQAGAAKWHPSVISHRLRASQHSYFWLIAWRDALDEVIIELNQRSVDIITKETVRKLHNFYYHSQQHSRDIATRHHLDKDRKQQNQRRQLHAGSHDDILTLLSTIKSEVVPLPVHIYPEIVQDNFQCYTDYEPRSIREASLVSIAVGGLAPDNGSGKGWKTIIYENLVNEKLVQKSLSRGYKDFKHLLYGNRDDGPLSFYIRPVSLGPVSYCYFNIFYDDSHFLLVVADL